MKQSDPFKCPVCSLEYDRVDCIPKILPRCGHTVCSKCLNQLLKTLPSKCPVDRELISITGGTSATFCTNVVLTQLMDDQTSTEYGICLLHNKPKSLFCMTDKIKVCPSCINKDHNNAEHKEHDIKPLSEIKNQAKAKSAQLKSEVIAFDADQEKILEELEQKKQEALGLKKRKFDAIRAFIDKKENEVWSDMGLVFAQKKTKTEEQVKKDQALKQQIQIHLTALEENKLDEAFFKALNKSGIKGNDLVEKEKEELDSLTKKLEGELSLAEGNISQSIVSVLEEVGPNIHQIRVQEVETPSKRVDAQKAIFLHINSLLKARRRGDKLKILQAGKVRTEEDIKNDLALLSDNKGVNKVKLQLTKKKLSEEALFALGYLWKGLRGVTELSIKLEQKYNTAEDYLKFFEHDFWVSDKIESLKLGSLNPAHSNVKMWDEARVSFIFKTITRLTNLKHLKISFNDTDITDETLITFANKAIPYLNKLESLDLNLGHTSITDAGIKELCKKIKDNLQKVKAFTIDLSYTNITMQSLLTLTNNGLCYFDDLQKFEMDISDFNDYKEDQIEEFWIALSDLMENVKSFSLDMSNTSSTDLTLRTWAQHVFSAMPHLEDFKLVLVECSDITDQSIENIIKYAPKLNNMKAFQLSLAANNITDYGLQILAKNLVPTMPKLERLQIDLDCNKIGDKGSIDLWNSMMPIVANLKVFSFSFSSSDISCESFDYFCQHILPNMSSLIKLEIESWAQFNPNSCKLMFLGLEKIAFHIENLKLSNSRSLELSDEVLLIFVKQVLPLMINLRKLHLSVDSQSLTWGSILDLCAEVSKLSHLEYLSIGYSYDLIVSEQDKEALRAVNPKFKFNRWSINYK